MVDHTPLDDATLPADTEAAGLIDNTEGGDPSATTSTEPGARIDHFEVIDKLGAGGMGVVLRATDLMLGRTVALKLVRPGVGSDIAHTRGTRRLLAEARAMAKISHPNVITVHEVGVVDGQVYLAMEFIDGSILSEWVQALRRDPKRGGRRRWRAIVDQWMLAGQGLVAAHDADLVHRDFKPANVLCSRDGRVLVTDFGIASFLRELDPDSPSAMHDETINMTESAERSLLEQRLGRLTVTGSTLGTPRYMAPEQYQGGAIDARADQFAFCVSLWEALYDQHPFDTRTAAALLLAVSAGKIKEPPRGKDVPDRLRKILTRGLSAKPDDRFPDMRALLGELAKLRRRGNRAAGWIAVAAALPAVAFGAWYVGARQPPDPCAGGQRDAWAQIWDDDRRVELERVFADSPVPFIRESWPRFETRVDGYVDDWDARHLEACRDTRVRATVSEQMLDRRMSCFDHKRRRVEALLDQMATGDAKSLEESLHLAASLPALDACDDLTALAEEHAPPGEDIQPTLEALDKDMAKAETLTRVGQVEEAVRLLTPWLDRLAALDRPGDEAEVHLGLANAWVGRDATKHLEHVRDAYTRAVAAGAITTATELAIVLSQYESATAEDPRDMFWLEVAEAGYVQMGRDPDYRLVAARASAARNHHDHEAAIEAGKQALVLAKHAEHEDQIHAEANLGALYAESRRFDEGGPHIHRAAELAAEYYGEAHPMTLKWRTNILAMAVMSGSNWEQAIADGEALLALQEAGLGGDTPGTAVTLTLLGVALRQTGDYAQAAEHDRRALAIREQAYGADSSPAIESREKLGRDLVLAGEHEEGIAMMRQVVDDRATMLGADNPFVGRSWGDLAWAYREAGQPADAILAARKAVATNLDADGQPLPQAFESYETLAYALRDNGDLAEALETMRIAVDLAIAASEPPRGLASAQFEVAKLEQSLRPGSPNAGAAAKRAIEFLDEAGVDEADLREEIAQWLRDAGFE